MATKAFFAGELVKALFSFFILPLGTLFISIKEEYDQLAPEKKQYKIMKLVLGVLVTILLYVFVVNCMPFILLALYALPLYLMASFCLYFWP